MEHESPIRFIVNAYRDYTTPRYWAVVGITLGVLGALVLGRLTGAL